MNAETYIALGVIQRKQGLKGSVTVCLYREVPQRTALKNLFIQIDHTLVPYAIESLSVRHKKAAIKLQGIDDPTVAHALRNRLVFVSQSMLPQPSAQEVRLKKLTGYQVTDVHEGTLGLLQAIYDFPQQQLLAVDYQGKELLIPYHKDIVINVAHERQNIVVRLPKGFIEASF